MTGPCHVCGTPQIARYERGDGVLVGMCCLILGAKVAQRHELARAVHRSAHGTDDPACPKCRVDDMTEMLWGMPGHVYDGGDR